MLDLNIDVSIPFTDPDAVMTISRFGASMPKDRGRNRNPYFVARPNLLIIYPHIPDSRWNSILTSQQSLMGFLLITHFYRKVSLDNKNDNANGTT